MTAPLITVFQFYSTQIIFSIFNFDSPSLMPLLRVSLKEFCALKLKLCKGSLAVNVRTFSSSDWNGSNMYVNP